MQNLTSEINMNTSLDDQYLRLKQIIGKDGKIPISRSKFYSDIKKGVYPPPIKLGRVSVWKASDILAALESAKNNEGSDNV